MLQNDFLYGRDITGFPEYICGIERVSTKLPSLKLTVSHLKMDAWNTIVSFWVPAYFQGCVCFGEGNSGVFLDLLHTWNLVGHLVYKQGNACQDGLVASCPPWLIGRPHITGFDWWILCVHSVDLIYACPPFIYCIQGKTSIYIYMNV